MASSDPLAKIKAYKPAFPKQAVFMASTKRFVGLNASSRSGKTYTAAPKFLSRVCADQKHYGYSDGHYWVITANFKIMPPVKEALSKLIPDSLVDWKRQGTSREFRAIHKGGGHVYLKNGAIIHFRSFEQGEGLVAADIRGIWVDEAARCNDSTTWANLRQRIANNYPRSWIIMTTSPAAMGEYYFEVYKRNEHNPEYEWVSWNSYDAASGGVLHPDEIESAKRSLPPHLFQREHMADWAAAGGLVYDNFDPDKHLIQYYDPKTHEKHWKERPDIIFSIDFGAVHPTVITVTAHQHDHYTVIENQTIFNPSMTEVVDKVIDLARKYDMAYHPERILLYYDYESAGKWFAGEFTARTKSIRNLPRIDVQMAWKTHRKAGIRLVYDALGSGRMRFVRSGTQTLVQGIQRYQWDMENDAQDDVIRVKDDEVDSWRYGVATHIVRERIYKRGSYWQQYASLKEGLSSAKP